MNEPKRTSTGISKWQKIKLGIIQSWPLRNKLRIAHKLLPMKFSNEQPLFHGISYLNQGNLLLTDTANYLDFSVFTTGSYEERIAHLIASQLQLGDVAMDVGANVGIHSITMAKSVGKEGKIYAFEPIAFLRNKLKQNLWVNRIENVTLVAKALSDKTEKTTVYFDETDSNLGTVSLSRKSDKSHENIEVDLGDEVMKDLNIKRLDFIKIDVEGFELKVLQGLEESIVRYKPRIIFEFDQNYIQRIQGTQDVKKMLFTYFETKRYDLYEITEQGLLKIHDTQSFPTSSNIFALPLDVKK